MQENLDRLLQESSSLLHGLNLNMPPLVLEAVAGAIVLYLVVYTLRLKFVNQQLLKEIAAQKQFARKANQNHNEFRIQTQDSRDLIIGWKDKKSKNYPKTTNWAQELSQSNEALQAEIEERLRVETALRLEAQQEKLVSSITQEIRQSLNLPEILKVAVFEIRQLLQIDRVLIYRFDADGSGTVTVESIEPSWSSILGKVIADPCLAEPDCLQQYVKGRVQAIADVEVANLAPCYQALLAQLEVRANLVVPIVLHNDQLWGLLAAQQCSGPRCWEAQEIDLLQQLATQIGIAIQQSQLYEQAQKFNAELEHQVQVRTQQLRQALDFAAVLKQITEKVRDSLNEKYILKTAVKQLTLRLKTYCCEAGLYDLGQQTSTICYEYVNSQVLPIQGATAPMTENPSIYQQLLNGRSFQFSWLAYADYLRPTGRTFTVLACPLVNDQGVIGDLWLYKASEEVFEEAEIWLVEQVASQCAIALRQARLYQNAQKQVKELQRLNYLKDDFLSTISHELRSPICNIQMATQMLDILFKPMEIETQKANSILLYIQILKNECQREIDLINDLLDLSRLNAETDPLALTEVNFNTWIDHVVEPFQRLAQKQQQLLQIKLPSSLPSLTTDLSYLKSILNELLSNACKYTPAGEKIVISSQALPDHLEISISNSGVEIPTEEINHVFEKFYRVPSSDPWKHSGVGLGLALVKKRIEQIQSTITVNSSHGWTTFILQLPWKIYDTPQSYMSRKDEL